MSFTAPQRGYHLITDEINEILGSQLEQFQCGMCNLFVQHMTNSLTLNENSDPSVRAFESLLTDDEAKLAVDVPSKPDALAMSLDIPIKGGMLALGPWQGIYLCEHSESGLPRDAIIVITAHGALAQTVSKVGLETPPQLSSCSIYTPDTMVALESCLCQLQSTQDPDKTFPMYKRPTDPKKPGTNQSPNSWPNWDLPFDRGQ